MQVKSIIISALGLIGRQDLASSLSGGDASAEQDETVTALLYCFNAVEDEVARCYLPLRRKEELKAKGGIYNYTLFSRPPVRIKRVLSGNGEEAPFKIFPLYMQVNRDSVTVEYEYSPLKKSLSSESDYTDGSAGEYLFACGAAAEYCLLNGEIEAAEAWESRYRTAIDEAQRRALPRGRTPLRSWV